jgi:hypothetical protein
MGKDKVMFILDPRTLQSAQSVKVHTGAKMAKCAWVKDNVVITSGSEMNERVFSIWDSRKLEKRVTGGDLPPGVGVTHLYSD